MRATTAATILSDTERDEIGAHAERLEARTGVQVVAALVGRCDVYPEAPWKAFALAASLALLAALPWQAGALLTVCVGLLSGASAALATVFVAPWARLFVTRARRETEARQYAAAWFLEHELGRTRARNAVLLLVGVFERSVVVLPDAGLPLPPAALQEVIARMRPRLAAGQTAPALHAGLDALEALLRAKGCTRAAAADEIAHELIEEKGA